MVPRRAKIWFFASALTLLVTALPGLALYRFDSAQQDPSSQSTLYFPRLATARATHTYPDEIWNRVADGSVAALAAAPSNPSILYASIVPGLIYKTKDAGKSWTRLSQETTAVALAVHPADPDVVFGIFSSPAEHRQVIRRSSDGGRTWTSLGGCAFMASLIVHPANGDILYYLADQIVFRSSDGGVTWKAITYEICTD